ncbi:hypothetical protein EDD70_0521 [Hydrogenoanaerobacterium saccharovorans]|uniref:Ig-like domain (Group 3) n=1 Tax=Hydrogenoanaerobacterium saccharovorans TaxID=474960 RepID=A0A1H8AXZ3_9FIRM|nr:hypothetical protein [Hydrogenoanaerobacterium saccharovorans]RPF47722.1 hypothetical protein EDD70_0521 [Hydrogenoanaerobacterium saccharovorans]SEM74774.1 hypothetical protein SAMN05216180_1570 [Hydrogenoanaerobacterium saccharovorans]
MKISSHRIMALVLAIALLFSATSSVTLANDSAFDSGGIDSGYADSGETDKSYDEVDGLDFAARPAVKADDGVDLTESGTGGAATLPCIWVSEYDDATHFKRCINHTGTGAWNGVQHYNGKTEIKNHTLQTVGNPPTCDEYATLGYEYCTDGCGYKRKFTHLPHQHPEPPNWIDWNGLKHIDYRCNACGGKGNNAREGEHTYHGVRFKDLPNIHSYGVLVCDTCHLSIDVRNHRCYSSICNLCGAVLGPSISYDTDTIDLINNATDYVYFTVQMNGHYHRIKSILARNLNSDAQFVVGSPIEISRNGDIVKYKVPVSMADRSQTITPTLSLWVRINLNFSDLGFETKGELSKNISVLGGRPYPVGNAAIHKTSVEGEWTTGLIIQSVFKAPHATAVEFALFDNQGKQITDWKSGVPTGNQFEFTGLFTPILNVNGRTQFYIRCRDSLGGTGEQSLHLEKTDTASPAFVHTSQDLTSTWARRKTATFIAEDGGIGQVQIAFNTEVDYLPAQQNGIRFARTYHFVGDVYSKQIRPVYAKDGLRNALSQLVEIDKLDNTAPTITAVSQSINESHTQITLTVTAHDRHPSLGEGSGLSKYAISDSRTVPTSGWQDSNQFTVNTNGTYYLWTQDVVSNISVPYAEQVNSLDHTPPTPPTITKTPTSEWHKDNVTVTISGGTDAESGVKGYQYQINGDKWIDYVAPFSVSDSANIYARTIDNVGLPSEPAFSGVHIDRIKPTGVITYSKEWTKDSVELTFTATDLGGAGVQHVRPAGGSWTDGDTVKHSVTTNGSHSFEVEDNAGNPETVSTEISNIDNVPPVIEEINFVKENDDLISSILHFFNKQVSIHITASDDASGVDKIQYQLIEKGNAIKEDGWLIYNPDELPKVSRRFSGTVAARCSDVATNISLVKEEPVTVEDTPPTATHTLSTTDWTDGKVTIKLKAQDDLSGVANITLPDGTVVDRDTAEFTVSENGTYRFIVVDKCGNILNYYVEVTNIDLTPCTATHTLNPIGYTNERVEITVTAEDTESGVKSITLPDGTVIDGDTASYIVAANSTYTFQLINNAGTTTDYDVVVDKIDKVQPTITKFELRETEESSVKQFFRSILPNMFTKQVEMIVEAEDDYSGVNKIEYQVVQKGAQLLDSGWTLYRGGEKPSRLKKDMDATVHVRTIDNATNISAVVSKDAIIDGTAPTATYTLSTTDWVKDGLDITVKAKDNIVGVASITLPDGTVVDGDTATYHVSRNGTYTFVLTDKLGTSTKYIVTVSNIEEKMPTAPTVDGDLKQEWSRTPTKLIFKSSAESGIKEYQYQIIKKDAANGNWLISSNGEVVADKEGIFDVIVRSVSVAGNVSTVTKNTVKNDFTPPTVTYNTTRNSIELKAEDNLSGVAKIVCEHGEVLGNEISCPMKRTEDHVYTVTDNAGNPTVVTVEFKRKSNPSKPDYEPVESEPQNDTKKPPRKPKPSTSVPEQQSSIEEDSKTEDTINLPEPEEKPRAANSSKPQTGENSETNVWTKVVRILSSFVRNTAEIASNIWAWLMSLPIIWRVVLFSLWWLLLLLIAYLIYQKVNKDKEKKADKQE